MSSVWMTADPGTSPVLPPASVVLPLLLRPSTASTAGRPELPWSGLRLVTALTTVLSNSTRHGPASGSSGASCKAMFSSCPAQPVEDDLEQVPGPGIPFVRREASQVAQYPVQA